jgi:hypothetical protein
VPVATKSQTLPKLRRYTQFPLLAHSFWNVPHSIVLEHRRSQITVQTSIRVWHPALGPFKFKCSVCIAIYTTSDHGLDERSVAGGKQTTRHPSTVQPTPLQLSIQLAPGCIDYFASSDMSIIFTIAIAGYECFASGRQLLIMTAIASGDSIQRYPKHNIS